VTLGDLAHDGKPSPGSFDLSSYGSLKKLKDALHVLRRNTWAPVLRRSTWSASFSF